MSKKKKKTNDLSFYNAYKSVRLDWGNVRPVSQIFSDKKERNHEREIKKEIREYL